MINAAWEWYYGSVEEELFSGCKFEKPYILTPNKVSYSVYNVRKGTLDEGDAVNIFFAENSKSSLECIFLERCAKVSRVDFLMPSMKM